jgi:hypothetical protein
MLLASANSPFSLRSESALQIPPVSRTEHNCHSSNKTGCPEYVFLHSPMFPPTFASNRSHNGIFDIIGNRSCSLSHLGSLGRITRGGGRSKFCFDVKDKSSYILTEPLTVCDLQSCVGAFRSIRGISLYETFSSVL